MSKSYKKKIKAEEVIEDEKVDGELSKKELYDLKKQEKEAAKKKEISKKKSSVKKKGKKTYQTNLAGRIFAVVMLILMVGSVIATIASYMR